MPSNEQESDRLLCSLRSADGLGVVRAEDRSDTDIEDLWSALTDPLRLAAWYGEIEGELRLGGEFRARIFASGWEGTGRVDVCERPRRLLLTMTQSGKSASVLEAILAADGRRTLLVIERRGVPLGHLAAYGAGWQIHVEDLGAFLAGRDRCDADARWGELESAYDVVAGNVIER